MTQQLTHKIGALTADDIGTTRLIVQHEGSTISGVLTALQIETEVIHDGKMNGEVTSMILGVYVTVTIGSITVGPLERGHACEVIS